MDQGNVEVVRHPETGEVKIRRVTESWEDPDVEQMRQDVEKAQAEVGDVNQRIAAKLKEIEDLKDEKADKERGLDRSKRLFDGYRTLVGDAADDADPEGSEGDDASGEAVGGEVPDTDAQPVW